MPKKVEWKADPNLVMVIRKWGDYHLTPKEKEEFLKGIELEEG